MPTHTPSTHRNTTPRRVGAAAAAALALAAAAAPNASAAVSFKADARMPALGDPWALPVGDLNQDGHPDIVAPSISGNNANVFLGRVGGAFGPPTETPTG